jgi:hypothetical protein
MNRKTRTVFYKTFLYKKRKKERKKVRKKEKEVEPKNKMRKK